MGLTSGYTFVDGDTVTAAKLNSLVNDASISAETITGTMIVDDAIESRHIAAGSVTSTQLADGAVSLGVIVSASGTAGTMIQSGVGGDFEELSPGADGTVLKSNGADASLSFGLILPENIDNTLISGLTEHAAPIPADLVMVKDTVAGINKHATVTNILGASASLTALTASTVASDDDLIVYDTDATTAKKISQAELADSVFKTVPSMDALTQYTVDDADLISVYDIDAGLTKKITKADLGTGGSMLEAQVPISAAGAGSNIAHTIDITPESLDSGVIVVYTLTVGGTGAWTGGEFTVTLPDAKLFLIEGVKKLDIVIENTSANLFTISSTDADGQQVYNYPSPSVPLSRASVITCTPFVVGSTHYWTVSMP